MRKHKHSYSASNHVVQTYPEVFITKNKNRLKLYRGGDVYLNHGDEFEIEFDNITRTKWLAEIKINGDSISDGGIVLRPGERVYLDTPNLTTGAKRRFRFETYMIKKGRGHITEENGLIEISFHKKAEPNPNWLRNSPYKPFEPHPFIPPYVWPSDRRDPYPRRSRTNDPIVDPTWTTCGTSTGDIVGDNITLTNSSDIQASCCSDPNNMTKEEYDTLYQMTLNFDEGKSRSMSGKLTQEETGRIEEGSPSQQTFIQSHDEFETVASYSTSFKILPLSKKATTVQEQKCYCAGCGRRCRKNENFCPSCGFEH